MTLAVLYTLRIVAGAAATGVVTSPWLLAFSLFVFFSLALVKRCSNSLVSLGFAPGRPSAIGRDYRVADLAVLWRLGVSASTAAVVVFGLFISAPETQARYRARSCCGSSPSASSIGSAGYGSKPSVARCTTIRSSTPRATTAAG